MPVDSTHRSYSSYIDRWVRCRDVYGGSDEVKKKTTKYLPLLEGHGNTSTGGYTGYIDRALFYPATGRTVAGLAGLVFAKPPTIAEVPKTQQPAFDDVTLTGTNLGSYGLTLCHEALITGRVGTLIDLPELGGRPYWVQYKAEQILNWRATRINGVQVLTLLVLLEEVERSTDDMFAPDWVTQYRVLALDENGSYTVTIWTPDEKEKSKFIKGATRIPLRRGDPLKFIPFTCMSSSALDIEVEPPPLLPLVDVNLSHYRTSADHEHGAHFTALPTPYITGHSLGAGERLTIGSGEAWVLPNPAATAGMVEFSGAGLGALEKLKEEKRQLMATLGARMLETDKNTAEAAQTVRLRHAGESSAMSVLADALGQSLQQSIRYHLWWAGLDEVIADRAAVTMNPDVMDELTSADITVLVDTWQKGGISKRTLHYNLTWGEWTRPGVTFEQEEQDIKEELPNKPPPPSPPPTPVITGGV